MKTTPAARTHRQRVRCPRLIAFRGQGADRAGGISVITCAGAYRAIAHLDQATTKELDKADFDPRLRELVRIRASQINGWNKVGVATRAWLPGSYQP